MAPKKAKVKMKTGLGVFVPVKADRIHGTKGSIGYGIFGITTKRKKMMAKTRDANIQRPERLSIRVDMTQVAEHVGVEPHEIKGIGTGLPQMSERRWRVPLFDFKYVRNKKKL